MDGQLDLYEYLAQLLVCFAWGSFMGIIFGFDGYVVVMLSLIAVLLSHLLRW